MKGWTTQSLTDETAKMVQELAELITDREDRLRPCSKHEAIHKAVAAMLKQYKRGKKR